MNYILTFPFNGPLGKVNIILSGDNMSEVRNSVMKEIGNKWSFLYTEENYKEGLSEINESDTLYRNIGDPDKLLFILLNIIDDDEKLIEKFKSHYEVSDEKSFFLGVDQSDISTSLEPMMTFDIDNRGKLGELIKESIVMYHHYFNSRETEVTFLTEDFNSILTDMIELLKSRRNYDLDWC